MEPFYALVEFVAIPGSDCQSLSHYFLVQPGMTEADILDEAEQYINLLAVSGKRYRHEVCDASGYIIALGATLGLEP